MKNGQLAASSRLYSPRATLCAIGIKLRSMKFFDTIADHVKIKQKTIKHTPVEKLTDAFIAILSGAHGLAEINTRVRADAALQRSFGRESCAEQSVVQETLDACDVENVRQMKHAFKSLTRAHSGAYRHPYKARLQLLDLDAGKRARTVLRIDAGGGSINDVNWLLSRGYQIHSKDVSVERAAGIAPTVREWFPDPLHPGRQVGWATCPSDGYEREVRRLIVRWRKRNGQECFAALLSTLEPRQVFDLLGESPQRLPDRRAVALAYAYLYDKRGGAIEIEIKEDKQGLGLAKRNKKRYYAQQMVVLLSALAHNVVVWAREWLSEVSKIKRQGVLRMVRDVFQVCGFVEIGARGTIKRIMLNGAAAWARRCANPLRALLKQQHVRVSLGET